MDKDRLVSALIHLDMREAGKHGHNRNALSLYLQAADECADMVHNGETWEAAFADCFTPCRDMLIVARELGLKLDVNRGRWVSANIVA